LVAIDIAKARHEVLIAIPVPFQNLLGWRLEQCAMR
jgi:hypothetical protein